MSTFKHDKMLVANFFLRKLQGFHLTVPKNIFNPLVPMRDNALKYFGEGTSIRESANESSFVILFFIPIE